MARASESLAANLLAGPGDDVARVRRLYARAYGREPTADEVAGARRLVRDADEAFRPREPDAGKRRLQAWACLCQVVLAANEFIYVR